MCCPGSPLPVLQCLNAKIGWKWEVWQRTACSCGNPLLPTPLPLPLTRQQKSPVWRCTQGLHFALILRLNAHSLTIVNEQRKIITGLLAFQAFFQVSKSILYLQETCWGAQSLQQFVAHCTPTLPPSFFGPFLVTCSSSPRRGMVAARSQHCMPSGHPGPVLG